MTESEETEEIKTFPIYPYLLQGQQALPNCKPISVGRSGDARYTTPLPNTTTPCLMSLLVVKMLTVLVSIISNSQVFLLEKYE